MTGEDNTMLVDHDGRDPAQLAHTGRNLLHLAGAMGAGCAGVPLQLCARSCFAYGGEGLSKRLEVGNAGARLAHHGLMDLVLVGRLDLLALRGLDHDVPTICLPPAGPARSLAQGARPRG